MKIQFALCLASAVGGSVLATALLQPAPDAQVTAQEFGRPPIGAANRPPAAGGLAVPGQAAPGSAETYTPDELVNISVYENVNRSVVNITTRGVAGSSLFLFEAPSEGAGSGAVLDKQGHLLTNYHVIEDARDINVTLYNGESYQAQLVGSDPTSDIAVLKIEAPPDTLFPLVFGDSNRLKVGQRVFAIGNPFGLERTLTTGIISSLNRSLPTRSSRALKSIIQIDAAINPGNSGGPLLDGRSRMIGMNTAIASKTGQNTGVGFAIPSSTIARVVPQLIENGRVIRPEVGITRVYQTDEGLLVATMVPGGPAEKAGLRGFKVQRHQRRRGPFIYEYETIDRSEADLIVGVDGQKISTADEFLDLIEAHKPGEMAVISVIREGREVQVPVLLGQGEA